MNANELPLFRPQHFMFDIYARSDDEDMDHSSDDNCGDADDNDDSGDDDESWTEEGDHSYSSNLAASQNSERKTGVVPAVTPATPKGDRKRAAMKSTGGRSPQQQLQLVRQAKRPAPRPVSAYYAPPPPGYPGGPPVGQYPPPPPGWHPPPGAVPYYPPPGHPYGVYPPPPPGYGMNGQPPPHRYNPPPPHGYGNDPSLPKRTGSGHPTCIVAGCMKQGQGLQYNRMCKRHFNMEKKRGTVNASEGERNAAAIFEEPQRTESGRLACIVEGCTKRRQHNRMCKRHFNMEKGRGTVNASEGEQLLLPREAYQKETESGRLACIVAGCMKQGQGRQYNDMCVRHFNMEKGRGTVNASEGEQLLLKREVYQKRTESGRLACIVAGCMKQGQGRQYYDMCIYHFKIEKERGTSNASKEQQLLLPREAERPAPGPMSSNGHKKKAAMKSIKGRTFHQQQPRRYGHGANGALCDICFQEEPDEIGGSSFIKCRECKLIVHSNCYDSREISVDSSGMFDCDICKALAKHEGQAVASTTPEQEAERTQKKDQHTVPVESPGPLGNDIEARDDGRIYPGPEKVGLDIFCQFCARRDVIGGLKPAENNTYVHLSCIMSTTTAVLNSNGIIVGLTAALLKTQKEQKKFEQERGFKATCEACLRSGGGSMLLRCEHGKGTNSQCAELLHPLCAEITDRLRVVNKASNGDVIGFKCAAHSYWGLDLCEICNRGNRQDQMIECDGCKRGCHLFCMQPPRTTVPDDDWFCQSCLKKRGHVGVLV